MMTEVSPGQFTTIGANGKLQNWTPDKEARIVIAHVIVNALNARTSSELCDQCHKPFDMHDVRMVEEFMGKKRTLHTHCCTDLFGLKHTDKA